ncbi:MAG: helix-turn-helix transcriptional regulator [Mobilitalea sp.]
MAKDKSETEQYHIGIAIKYFRQKYNISQGELCEGLCSVTTLFRIEVGERTGDVLLLQMLFERLGKSQNEFELILSDTDYELIKMRGEIERKIKDKNLELARKLLEAYEKRTNQETTVEKQFIAKNKAFLYELEGGNAETVIQLLVEAITYTVPHLGTKAIKDHYLGKTELKIMIDIIDRLISLGKKEDAKEIIVKIMEYLDLQNSIEADKELYPKLAVMASGIFIQEKELEKALEICNRGIVKCKGSRKLEFQGELAAIKAGILETTYKKENIWEQHKKECLQYYLQAYYVYEFYEEQDKAENLREYLKGEYQWASTD